MVPSHHCFQWEVVWNSSEEPNQGEIVTLKNKYGAYLYLDEAPMLCMPMIVVKIVVYFLLEH